MTLHRAKPLRTNRPQLLSLLYGALLDLASIRAVLDEIRPGIGPHDAERLQHRLELLEGTAAQLIEKAEPAGAAFSH